MSALNAWLRKYGGATTQPAQTDQDNQKNALAAWLEKYNNFTPSGADTVQSPAEPQPNGYKSQNAAHLSSGRRRQHRIFPTAQTSLLLLPKPKNTYRTLPKQWKCFPPK